MDSRQIKRLAKKIRINKAAIDHVRILTDAEAALEKSRKLEKTLSEPSIWRIIMKSRITKPALTGSIVIALVIGIMYFGGAIDRSSVVWAEAIKNIEQANSAIWHEKRVITCEGQEISFLNSDVVRYYSSEHGGREDMYNTAGLLLHRVYWLVQENVRVKIVPELKRYERTELTEAEREAWGPHNLKAIGELLESQNPTPLGRKKINDREAEGFELRDSELAAALVPIRFDSMLARAWIDVETSLPVRYEAEVVTSDTYIKLVTGGKPVEAKVTSDEFQWNVELEPSIFEPNIPSDYTQGEIRSGLLQPDIPAIYKDALDRYVDEHPNEITGEQILVDMTFFQTQGQLQLLRDFLDTHNIVLMASPTTDRLRYAILGPEEVRAVFEFSQSSDVLRLLARPMVIGPDGYTASAGIEGFAVDTKVEKRNDHFDLTCSLHKGQEVFETPTVKIRPDQALLIGILQDVTSTPNNNSSAENDAIRIRALFLIKTEQVEF